MRENASKEPLRRLGFSDEEMEKTTIYEPAGCDKCTNGYSGRVAIFEALYFDEVLRRMIFDAGDEIDEGAIRQHAIKNGMLTLRASGRLRIKNGLTSVEEVMAITLEDQ